MGEDSESIKDGGNLDTKLSSIHENAEDEDNKSDCKVSLDVAVAELQMSTSTEDGFEKKEEIVKGDSVDFQTVQEDKENDPVLMCVDATLGEQSANNEGEEMDKGDFSDSFAVQQSTKNGPGLASAESTSGLESGASDGGTMDTA